MRSQADSPNARDSAGGVRRHPCEYPRISDLPASELCFLFIMRDGAGAVTVEARDIARLLGRGTNGSSMTSDR